MTDALIERARSHGLGEPRWWVTSIGGGLFAKAKRVFVAFDGGFAYARGDTVEVFAWPDIDVFRLVEVPDSKQVYGFRGWTEIRAGDREIVFKPSAAALPELTAEQLTPLMTTLHEQYTAWLDEVVDEALETEGWYSFGDARIDADGVHYQGTTLPWKLVGAARLALGHLRIHDTGGRSKPALHVSASTVRSVHVLAEYVTELARRYRDTGDVGLPSGAPAADAVPPSHVIQQDPSFTRPEGVDELLTTIEAAAAKHGLTQPLRWWIPQRRGVQKIAPQTGLVLYSDGVVLASSRKKAEAVAWPDVRWVMWSYRQQRSHWLVTFDFRAGKCSFTLDNRGTGFPPVEDFQAVGSAIEHQYAEYLLRLDERARADGGTSTFGKWQLTPHALVAKKKSVPWPDVERVEFTMFAVNVHTVHTRGKTLKPFVGDVASALALTRALRERGIPVTTTDVLLR
ncbi:hypothetical protein [Saccharomonospora cyanea]|uniref:Uncharacterized protein n=1 Tax=Saccharomonospora cyanea NA-134 TaxID=882082 RepID=H5XFI7_9PSEU|nr:hypothetical protein [Saccharomonospora cyanea]EHR59355.1 hypothetical protein SaccyDRAFT_0421 [Saccharomonospora cyanea NA-134]